MPNRKQPLHPAARWAWITIRRSKYRLAGHFQRHSVWPLATVTGVIGIILLLVMHLSAAVGAGQFDESDEPFTIDTPEQETGSQTPLKRAWDGVPPPRRPLPADEPLDVFEEPPPFAEPSAESPMPADPFELIGEQPLFDPPPQQPIDPPPEQPIEPSREPIEAVPPPIEEFSIAEPPEWEIEIERRATSDDVARAAEESEHTPEFLVGSNESVATLEGETLLEQLELLPLAEPPAQADDWSLFDIARLRDADFSATYEGLLDPPQSEWTASGSASDDAFGETPSGYRELALSVHKEYPEQATTANSYEYQIVVRNEGVDAVDHFDVEEHVGRDFRVLNATPDAYLADNRLSWRLRNLQPGDEQTLAVSVKPIVEGPAEHVTLVSAAAAVGAETQVESPKLEFDVTAPPTAQVGQPCRIRFRVTNIGSSEIAGIVIEDDLSDELAHKGGRELDYDIGTLAPGESKQAQLVVRADALGTGTSVARLAVGDAVIEQVSSRVEIEEQSQQPTVPTASPATATRQPARLPAPCPCCGRYHVHW